jgi:hypothetical protein
MRHRRRLRPPVTLLLWTLLPTVSAHAKPRPMSARRDRDFWRDFRCPGGDYLKQAGRLDRTPRLQRHIRQAFAHSFASSQLDAPVRGLHNATHFFTHESAGWPKPERCQARRAHVCHFNPHFCLLLAQGNSPRTSLTSEHHGIEFRQVWKVASSSLASFFYCNMWGHLKAEKLLPAQPPPRAPFDGPTRRVVFPTREPISRFVASSFEVLERLLNHVSPSGQRMPPEMYTEPNGPFASTVLLQSTAWFEPLQRLINASRGGGTAASGEPTTRPDLVYQLVNGFVEDIECGIVYSAAEHLATQMSFLTSGYEARAKLDFQVQIPRIRRVSPHVIAPVLCSQLPARPSVVHLLSGTSSERHDRPGAAWTCNRVSASREWNRVEMPTRARERCGAKGRIGCKQGGLPCQLSRAPKLSAAAMHSIHSRLPVPWLPSPTRV